MKKISLLILFLITSILAFAYENQERWRTHFSYSTTNKVCITENKVFALANGFLYSVSKEDGVLDTYTKLDGFSENKIIDIHYSNERKCLIIVYDNSNIDILESNGTIYNIPDLYQKNISVDKTIYQITTDKEYAYLSTGFGIVVVNLKKKEIANTYIIGPDATKVPVYGIAVDDEYIYALSTDFIYKAKKTNSNLLDYNYWQEDKMPLKTTEECKTLFKFANSFFTIKDKNIVYKIDTITTDFYKSSDIAALSFTNNKMIISGGNDGIRCYNEELSEIIHYNNHATYTEYDPKQDTYWIASTQNGCVLLKNNETNNYQIPSPKLTDGQRVIYSGNRMYYINGRGDLVSRGYKAPIISYVEEHRWHNITPTEMGVYDFVNKAYDVTSIVTDPKDKTHWYFTTFGEGVFEVKNNKVINLFNGETTNEQLPFAEPNNIHTNYCDGLSIDSYGNIYTASTVVNHPLSIYSTSNGWKNLIHSNDQVTGWGKGFVFTKDFRLLINTRYNPYLYLWNDNKTPFDPSDDKTRVYYTTDWIDKDGKHISADFIYDVQEDKNGTLWAATDAGPILFQNPHKILSENDYRCTRIKINRNDDSGLADYLLDGETIYAVEIDYGNRKWLGTANSGLYLVSEDGTETLAHFTKENSPLSSNSISDLELDPKTGELFIVTPEGLFSYKTLSTAPVKEASKETIFAYPNPVRPEYTGEVMIGGLEEDSNVWITDASGDLIFKGRTVGGSLAWNCKNKSGQNVTGGIYYVLVSNENEDRPKSVATKILIVR